MYRRLVPIHHALATADRPTEESHAWCMHELMSVLAFISGKSYSSERLAALESVARAARRAIQAPAGLDRALARLSVAEHGAIEEGAITTTV